MTTATRPLSAASRVLSLDIRPQRIAYVVFETPSRLLDWAVVRLRPENTHADRIGELLTLFHPSVLVLRKIAYGSIRDLPAVRRAIITIRRVAKSLSIPSALVSYPATIRLFRQYAKPTKWEIAVLITDCFPELAARLPPRRKAWQAERWNMCLFDSVALGLAYFALQGDIEVAGLLASAASFRRPLGGAATERPSLLERPTKGCGERNGS